MSNTKKPILLLEGKNDEYIISELCKDFGIKCDLKNRKNNDFDIKVSDGIENLKEAIDFHIMGTNEYSKVWVIIDADSDFSSIWDSIKNIIKESNRYNDKIKDLVDFPKEGLVLNPDDPANIIMGVWIMPNNSDIGMLEDFLISLIEEKDSLYKRAESMVYELNSERDKYSSLFKEVHSSKAKVHTWLAWQDEPRTPISVAINKKLLNTDKAVSKTFEAWIKQLIEE